MTKEEFISMYLKNSGLTQEDYIKYKMEAIPCDCDYDNCKGWQMKTQNI